MEILSSPVEPTSIPIHEPKLEASNFFSLPIYDVSPLIDATHH